MYLCRVTVFGTYTGSFLGLLDAWAICLDIWIVAHIDSLFPCMKRRVSDNAQTTFHGVSITFKESKFGTVANDTEKGGRTSCRRRVDVDDNLCLDVFCTTSQTSDRIFTLFLMVEPYELFRNSFSLLCSASRKPADH